MNTLTVADELVLSASTEGVITAPLSRMVVGAYNPRKEISPEYIQALAETIKAQGVLHMPIGRIVEIDGVHWIEIVAGQCRYLACKLAYGEEGTMRIDIRSLDDAQAVAASATENVFRNPMNIVEEAEAAAECLAKHGNNRAVTAADMGWGIGKLNSMLKLMNCSERVRKALVAKTVDLGIAELLAGLTHEKQDTCLDDFAKRGATPTIAQFKTEIQQISKQLDAAIFNKADCVSCQHNSSIQRSMFDTAIDAGYCMSGSCYDEKTDAELEQRAAALKDDFPKVEIVRPHQKYQIVKIVAEGEGGLGSDQVDLCRACTNFGAAVSAMPSKLGNVSRGLCFDPTCNKTLAKKYADALLAASAPAEAGKGDQPEASTNAAPDDGQKTVPGQASPVVKRDPKRPPIPTVTQTNAVNEFRYALYRTIVAKEVGKSPLRSMALLIALASGRRLSAVDSGMVREHLKAKASTELNLTDGVAPLFAAALTMPENALQKACIRMSGTSAAQLTPDELESLIVELEPAWSEHFVLDENFLKVLTKSEMLAVAKDVGLGKAMGDGFSSVAQNKKDDMIKQLLGVKAFEYKGAIPRVLLPKGGKRR